MKIRRKPHFIKNRFHNHEKEKYAGFFLKSVFMLILAWSQRKKLNDLKESQVSDWIIKADPLSCSVDPIVTWIGHASFLIQIGDVNIITDPIFGNTSMLYPRIFEPGISLNKLPNIDYVLISHNHRYHMDKN